jgi:hypothetical protein
MHIRQERCHVSTISFLHSDLSLAVFVSQLSDFVTGDLFQLHAMITAIACAMFNLTDTGFDALKMMAVSTLGALTLRLQADGVSIDTVQNNAAQTTIALALAFIALVD